MPIFISCVRKQWPVVDLLPNGSHLQCHLDFGSRGGACLKWRIDACHQRSPFWYMELKSIRNRGKALVRIESLTNRLSFGKSAPNLVCSKIYKLFYCTLFCCGCNIMSSLWLHVISLTFIIQGYFTDIPDSKIHGAIMGPTWGQQGPGGCHVGPMNLAI